MLGPLISHELRYCYPLPTGCYEIDLKVFRRLHLTKWSRTGVHSLTEVHYHHSTTLPAQEGKSKSAYEERKPLSDFTVAVGQGPVMAHRRQAIEIAGANIFLKFVNGGNGCALERKRLRRGILRVSKTPNTQDHGGIGRLRQRSSDQIS